MRPHAFVALPSCHAIGGDGLYHACLCSGREAWTWLRVCTRKCLTSLGSRRNGCSEAVAFFLLFGFSVWPTIVVGAFLVNVTTAGTLLTSGSIAVGNTLGGLLGAWLVQRFAHGLRAFESPQDVFKFAILAGLLSPIVSATIGVTSLTWGGFASLYDLLSPELSDPGKITHKPTLPVQGT